MKITLRQLRRLINEEIRILEQDRTGRVRDPNRSYDHPQGQTRMAAVRKQLMPYSTHLSKNWSTCRHENNT